jgi:hypothetical protein
MLIRKEIERMKPLRDKGIKGLRVRWKKGVVMIWTGLNWFRTGSASQSM